MVALAAYALPLVMLATNKRGFSSARIPLEASQS